MRNVVRNSFRLSQRERWDLKKNEGPLGQSIALADLVVLAHPHLAQFCPRAIGPPAAAAVGLFMLQRGALAVIASVLRENERRVRTVEVMLRLRSSILRGPDICLYRALPTWRCSRSFRTATLRASKISTRQPSRSREGVQQLFLATRKVGVVNRFPDSERIAMGLRDRRPFTVVPRRQAIIGPGIYAGF